MRFSIKLVYAFAVVASGLPEPTAAPIAAPYRATAPDAQVTHAFLDRARLDRRDIISDFESDVGSLLTEIGSAIPSYVASGIPNFFQNFPVGQDVISSLGLSDEQLDALPTQVLNFPPYANWTENGWNVRFHGNIYKQPNTSIEDLNRLANVFLIGTDIQDLPPSNQTQARNLTAEILIVQQGDERPTFSLAPAPTAGASGEQGGGGAVTPLGGAQEVQFPYNTTFEGDFDAFLPIQLNGLMPGNETKLTQRLNVYTVGTNSGNATAYLYPPQGLTVVSDIDDILRVTKIYDPKEGLLNSFARPFTPWENMPEIYANWSQNLAFQGSPVNFHYLTTTPEQVTRNYEQFIYANYPGGSFDTRPLNFSDVPHTLSIRKFLLEKLFETFPQRKFILVADTSNSDVMKDYPQLAHDFPNQVQCIFLRNTSATDSSDRFPYDTSGFEGLNKDMYMFFVHADNLKGLDIANGQCVNATVAQNLTYGYQGLPFGVNLGDGESGDGQGLRGFRRDAFLLLIMTVATAGAWLSV